jgi:hypothetical protein
LALTLAATLLVVLIVSAPRPAAADGRQIRFDDVSIDVGALAPATRDAVERSNDWRAVTIDVPTLAARLDRSVAI